jgi:hypothetical protein
MNEQLDQLTLVTLIVGYIPCSIFPINFTLSFPVNPLRTTSGADKKSVGVLRGRFCSLTTSLARAYSLTARHSVGPRGSLG